MPPLCVSPRWPRGNTPQWIAERQERLRTLAHWDAESQHVLDGQLDALTPFQECLTGQMTLPVCVVGPLRLNWGQYELDRQGQLHERGRQENQVFVPLAHTEGGLSASIQRGVTAVALAGGVRTYVLADRITRDSCFVFSSTQEALSLADWVAAHAEDMATWLKDPAHSSLSDHLLSRHAVLHEVQTHVVGPMCHVLYRFHNR